MIQRREIIAKLLSVQIRLTQTFKVKNNRIEIEYYTIYCFPLFLHGNSDSSKTIHQFSSVELREAIESIATEDFTSQSQTISESVTESVGESSDEHVIEPVTGMTNGI